MLLICCGRLNNSSNSSNSNNSNHSKNINDRIRLLLLLLSLLLWLMLLRWFTTRKKRAAPRAEGRGPRAEGDSDLDIVLIIAARTTHVSFTLPHDRAPIDNSLPPLINTPHLHPTAHHEPFSASFLLTWPFWVGGGGQPFHISLDSKLTFFCVCVIKCGHEADPYFLLRAIQRLSGIPRRERNHNDIRSV